MEGNTIETIEKLTQENEKLNGRLRKAIQVFNDQKANILRLESERDTLTVRVEELETKQKEIEEQDTNFFAQEEEIAKLQTLNENLHNRLVQIEADKKALEGKYEERKQDLFDTQAQVEELKTKNKTLGGKNLALTNEVKQKEEYITTVTGNVNAFIDKMKICMGSLSEQVTLISKDVEENNLL